MSWYYAENNDRRGPIEDAAFDALVRAGSIRPDTLVWQDGMPNWVPFTDAGYRPAAAVPPPVPAAAGAVPGVEMGVCSESGRTLPRSELVEIDGRLVSAEYKHVALQRIREGVSSGGAVVDPEALGRQIEERGYDLRVGETVGRGWTLIKEHFWLCVGATLLTMLVSQAAGMIPIIGPIVVFGPLTGGLYYMMVRMLRRETATVGDAFVGFQRGFGQLLGVTAILFGVIFACFIPGFVCFMAGIVNSAAAANREAGPGAFGGLAIAGGVLFLIGFVFMAYFWTCWVFALPLVIDKQIEFWPAMKLSRRAVRLHWWRVFGVLLLTGLVIGGLVMLAVILVSVVFAVMSAAGPAPEAAIGVAVLLGLLCLCAFLAVLPLSYSSVAVAYETIFGERKTA